MSLLWATAAWWNGEREFEHEGDDEYPLRDPEESLRQRGQRYKQRVMENHGVDPATAQKAIQHVVGHLGRDTVSVSPTEYGFASASHAAHEHFPPDISQRLMDPHTWKDRQPQDVDLTEPIHASQDFVRPSSVAHNLFHPGQRQPDHEDHAVGDPDYHPDDYRDEDDQGGDHSLHSQVYFMRRDNGRMEVVDGHHRVATNLLLGKKSMPGKVIHESEIPRRRRR